MRGQEVAGLAGKQKEKTGKKAAGLDGQEKQKKPPRSKARPTYRGAPRKYNTPGALARACQGYFDSISLVTPMLDPVTGQPVRNDAGELIETVRWLRPPTETALALHIGIDPRTWTNYRDREDLGPVVAWAKEICKSYLLEQLVTRQKGSVNGIIFALGNYGMKEQSEVEFKNKTLEEWLQEQGGAGEF